MAYASFIVKGILNIPPSSPNKGDVYIVGTSPPDIWAGFDGYVMEWTINKCCIWWKPFIPKVGYYALVCNTVQMQPFQYMETGGWTQLSTSALLS